MAIEKVINITVNAEGATANVVQLDNAIENTTDSVNDLAVAQTKLKNSSKNLDTQMTKGTVPAMTSFSQVIQDAPFGIRGVANNIQQLTAQMGHLSANAGGMKNALKSMVGSLVGPAGILLAVSVVTSLLVSFGDVLFNNTKKIEKQATAYDELNDAIKSNITLVESQIKLAKELGQETDVLERQRILDLQNRRAAIVTQLDLMAIALKADKEAAVELSFWDKWFGSGDESRDITEEEQSRINVSIKALNDLKKELAAVDLAITKALLGEGVELRAPEDEDFEPRNPVTGQTLTQTSDLLSDENTILFDSIDAQVLYKRQQEEEYSKWVVRNSKEVAKAERDINIEKSLFIMDSAVGLSMALESLAGENTELAKAAGIAGVIIDGTAAIIATWAGYGSQSFVGTAAAIAQSVAITAMMVASVGKIKAVQKPTRGGGFSADTSSPTQPPAPQFNVVGTSDTNQLANTVNEQRPVKAYVVASDVTTQQGLDRNIVDNASFG